MADENPFAKFLSGDFRGVLQGNDFPDGTQPGPQEFTGEQPSYNAPAAAPEPELDLTQPDMGGFDADAFNSIFNVAPQQATPDLSEINAPVDEASMQFIFGGQQLPEDRDFESIFGAVPIQQPQGAVDEDPGLSPYVGEATKGVGATGVNIVAGLAALVGAEETAAAIAEYAPKARVGSVADVGSLGDAVDYVSYGVGTMLPDLVGAMATGGVGGAALKGTRLGRRGGQLAGALTYSEARNVGDNLLRQYEETGETDPALAWAAGTVAAALDTIVPFKGLKAMDQLGLVSELAGAAKKQGAGKKLLKEFFEGAAMEGATEAAQQTLNQFSANTDNYRIIFNPETPEEQEQASKYRMELVDSFILGGIGGGIVTGGIEGAKNLAAQAQIDQTAPPEGAPVSSGPLTSNFNNTQNIQQGEEELAADQEEATAAPVLQAVMPAPSQDPAPTPEGNPLSQRGDPIATANVRFTLGPKRPNPPKQELLDVASSAAVRALGPGATVEIYSGSENPGERHGSHRHGTGLAGDMRFYDADGNLIKIGTPEHERVAEALVESGAMGLGFGQEYMGDGFHADLVGSQQMNGGQGGNIWGSGAKAMSDRLLPGLLSNQNGRQRTKQDPDNAYDPEDYRRNLMRVESSSGRNLSNPNSSAQGRFQFVTKTWNDYVNRYHPEWREGRTPQEVLDLRLNPRFENEIFDQFTADNRRVLEAEGIPINNATLGMAHRFGPGTAAQMLSGDPNAPLSDYLSEDGLRQNPDLTGERSTVGGILDWYEQELGSENTFTPGRSVDGRSRLRNPDGTVVDSPRTGFVGRDDIARSEDDVENGRETLDKLDPPDFATAVAEEVFSTAQGVTDSPVPVQLVEAVGNYLDKAGSAQEALQRLADVADGRATIQTDGLMMPEEMRQSVVQAARNFGYDLELPDVVDVAQRQFSDAVAPAVDLSGAELATRVRANLSPDATSTGITLNNGGQIFLDTMQAADQRLRDLRTGFDNRMEDARGQQLDRLLERADAASVAIQKVDRARQGLERLLTPVDPNQPPQMSRVQAANAVSDLVMEYDNFPQEVQRALAAVPVMQQALGGYVRGATSVAGGAAMEGKSNRPFQTAMTKLGRLMEGSNRSKGVNPKLIGSIIVDSSRTVANDRAGAASRKKDAKAAEKKRGTVFEAEAQKRLQAERVEAYKANKKAIARSDAQRQRDQKSAIDGYETLREVMFGPMEERTGKTRAQQMDILARKDITWGSEALGKIGATWAKVLTADVIAQHYAGTFKAINYNGKYVDPLKALIRERNLIEQDMNSGNAETQQYKDRIKDLLFTEGDPRQNLETMTILGKTASQHNLFLIDPDVVVNDKETHVVPLDDPRNEHLTGKDGEVSDQVEAFYNEFLAQPKHVRLATAEYITAQEKLNAKPQLELVNQILRDVGVAPVGTLRDITDPNKLRSVADGEMAVLSEETEAALKAVAPPRLRGNYVPTQRSSGQYFVSGSQKVQIGREKTADEARRAYEQAKFENVHLRPEGGVASPQPVRSDDGSFYVPAEVFVYSQFDKLADAQAFEQLLRDVAAGSKDLQDAPNLRGWRPDPDGIRSASLKDANGLQNAFGSLPAQLLDVLNRIAADDPELRGILVASLPANMLGKPLITRQGVLGVETDGMQELHSRSIKVNATVYHIRDQQLTGELMGAMKQQAAETTGRLRSQRVRAAAVMEARERQQFLGGIRIPPALTERLSQLANFLYLSGPSHVILQLTQMTTIGFPYLANEYGYGGAFKVLGQSYKDGLVSIIKAYSRRSKMSFREASNYVSQGLDVDARLFNLPLDQVASLPDEAVFNRPFGADTFALDPITGRRDTLLISKYDMDRYRAGEITAGQLRFNSRMRKRGQLGDAFQDMINHNIDTNNSLSGTSGRAFDAVASEIYRAVGIVPAGAVEFTNRQLLSDFVLAKELQRRGLTLETATDGDLDSIADKADTLQSAINANYNQSNRSQFARFAGPAAMFTTLPLTVANMSIMAMATAMDGQERGPFKNAKTTRRYIALASLTMYASAGVTGMVPFYFYQAMIAGASIAALLFGDAEDDDDPGFFDLLAKFDYNSAVRGVSGQFAEMMGLPKDFTQNLVAEGPVNALTGADFGRRVSVSESPFPGGFKGSLSEGREGVEKALLEMGGPAVDMGLNAFGFGTDLLKTIVGKGDPKKDLLNELMYSMPKPVRDTYRGLYQYNTEGLVSRNGADILSPEQLTWADSVRQAFGFTPLTVKHAYEARNLEYEADQKAAAMVSAGNAALYDGEVDRAIELYAKAGKLGRNVTADSAKRSVKAKYKEAYIRSQTGGLRSMKNPTSRQIAEDIY